VIDGGSPFGQLVERRLRDELVVWLITVDRDGRPQPTRVWFLRDGDDLIVYSRADARRLVHLARGSRVALLFEQRPRETGVVLHGDARRDDGLPSPDANPPYLAKYADRIARGLRMTPAEFARRYPVGLRIAITGVSDR